MNYQLSIINYQLSIMSYELWILNYQSSIMKSSETSGDLRKPPGTFGNLRGPSKTFENLWKPLETFKNLEKPSETSDSGFLGIRTLIQSGSKFKSPPMTSPSPPPPLKSIKRANKKTLTMPTLGVGDDTSERWDLDFSFCCHMVVHDLSQSSLWGIETVFK